MRLSLQRIHPNEKPEYTIWDGKHVHSILALLKQRIDRLGDAIARRAAASSLFKRRFLDSWVLMDRIHNANDSAEHLFKYLRRERPDINSWFVLEKGVSDWTRLRKLFGRRIVAHGSLKWRLLMLNCTHFASSHIGLAVQRPNQLLEQAEGGWLFTFLQHGVIKDDISVWLNQQRMNLLITSTPDEYNAIVSADSCYNLGVDEVKLTGIPRFDQLLETENLVSDLRKNIILVAPTWRVWLNEALKPGSQRRSVIKSFAKSGFCKRWLDFLGCEELRMLVRAEDMKILFLPHPNIESAFRHENIPLPYPVVHYENEKIHEFFARAAVFITDYSSSAFNAAYLKRPVIYYQFDRDRFFSSEHIRPGYFNYERDGFGPVVKSKKELLECLSAFVKFGTSSCFLDRMLKTFPHRDGRCCERVVREMELLGERTQL